MKMVMRTLNDYLRQKRLDSGLSQLDVAKTLGYSSPQFVSNWERGLVSPPLETIAVLIDLYKISSGEVINQILAETKEYLEANLTTRRRKNRVARKNNSPFGSFFCSSFMTRQFKRVPPGTRFFYALRLSSAVT